MLSRREWPGGDDLRSEEKEDAAGVATEDIAALLAGNDQQDRPRERQEPNECPHHGAIIGARPTSVRVGVPLAQVANPLVALACSIDK